VKMCASKACADTGDHGDDASTACADAGDHGEDACKYGVGRRGRSRSRRVQVRRGQTRAFKVKKRASKACADAGD